MLFTEVTSAVDKHGTHTQSLHKKPAEEMDHSENDTEELSCTERTLLNDTYDE